jgi:ketosteroid isomerase-like protein
VLVLVRNSFRGRDGIEFDSGNQAIFTLSGGRVTRFRDFLDEQAAREAFEAETDH